MQILFFQHDARVEQGFNIACHGALEFFKRELAQCRGHGRVRLVVEELVEQAGFEAFHMLLENKMPQHGGCGSCHQENTKR